MIAPYIQNVLDHFENVKKAGRGWVAYCPIHENDGARHQPSLKIDIGEDGRALLHCHAGCPTPEHPFAQSD